jgi:hypothetical protein
MWFFDRFEHKHKSDFHDTTFVQSFKKIREVLEIYRGVGVAEAGTGIRPTH